MVIAIDEPGYTRGEKRFLGQRSAMPPEWGVMSWRIRLGCDRAFWGCRLPYTDRTVSASRARVWFRCTNPATGISPIHPPGRRAGPACASTPWACASRPWATVRWADGLAGERWVRSPKGSLDRRPGLQRARQARRGSRQLRRWRARRSTRAQRSAATRDAADSTNGSYGSCCADSRLSPTTRRSSLSSA